jgi:hypothetical protein
MQALTDLQDTISHEDIRNLLDFKLFAASFLKIRSKSGAIQPLVFNQAQNYINYKLDDQLKRTGKVRAVILKGRQAGTSTLIQARYSHRVLTSKGIKAYILTHEQEATNNLFEMAKRFMDNLPKGLAPVAEASTSTKLYYKSLDSGYSVGTAGNKGAGRSQTIQLFHGSEVGFWPHASEHAKGVMQAISRDDGTEVILESTANGIGNYFYHIWLSAMAGKSEFQAIFVPWYWQREYVNTADGFTPTADENELLDHYARDGLSIAHLSWRRLKIAEFSNDYEVGLEQFKQEYPMTASEAFRNPIDNAFINSKHVMRARKAIVESDAKLIIGVDVAISDKDKTAIIRRKGRLTYSLEKFNNHNTMEICGKIKRIILEEKPEKVYIDCIGIGAGVVDRLQEMGYTQVEGVNVSRSANDKEHYKNLRAELWGELRDWLGQEMAVQIPDDDELHGELCSLGYKFNSNGQLQIESKDDLKARGMPSPDGADALCLTFSGGFYQTMGSLPVDRLSPQEKGMFL